MSRKIHITDVVLRDGNQSLIATRMRIDDMLPVCEALDNAGYWSLEVWGGATFDSCVRFLKEDPWERLRTLRRGEGGLLGLACRQRAQDADGQQGYHQRYQAPFDPAFHGQRSFL